jgi:hypothetical protein
MGPRIIDTNVPIAANGREGGSLACRLAAIDWLQAFLQTGTLVLDDQFRILTEYDRYLNNHGQPGTGDEFYKWVLVNMHNTSRCHQLPLEEPAPKEFSIFPPDEALASFDLSDRKFVALCLTHAEHPPVVVAGDRGWRRHEAALRPHGVLVEFLCADATTYSRK